MNHSTSGSILVSKAITGFVNYKTAEGLTDHSVDAYKRVLNQSVSVHFVVDNQVGDDVGE